VISAVFVFRDTRGHSLSAGISWLFATCVSFALCLVYLLIFPANPLGMAILIAIGALLATLVGRREVIVLATRRPVSFSRVLASNLLRAAAMR